MSVAAVKYLFTLLFRLTRCLGGTVAGWDVA